MASRRGSRLLTAVTAQYAGLAVLAVLTLVLCYLALTRNMDADSAGAGSGGSGLVDGSGSGPSAGESGGTDGGTGAGGGATDGATDGAGDGASGSSVVLPNVPDQVSADFASGAALPQGARLYDNQAVGQGSGMAVGTGGLVQGAPQAAGATSSLEVELPSDVQKLAATVSFPGTDPGTVVLVAWQDSLVDARTAGRPVPASGMRLEVGRSSWQLTLYRQGVVTLKTGTFAPITGSAQVALYRVGPKAYVVDPSGKVTTFRNPAIASLAGPWACWQLTEATTGETPARLEAVSAG